MNHEDYMLMAFEQAEKGLGHTSPHPMTGAVLVCDQKILGSGYYQKYGSVSAVELAVRDAKARGHKLDGAILYCNLDFPSIELNASLTGLSKIILSQHDPKMELDGKAGPIRSMGIEVISGVLEKEGQELNEVYFKFIKTNVPFIHLVTGREPIAELQLLRQKYDCVMVDRKTIELENPSLTIAPETFARIAQPLRIILGELQDLKHDSQIFQDIYKRNTMIVATDSQVKRYPDQVRFLDSQGVAMLSVKENAEREIDLQSLLKSLASLKLSSLLIENDSDLASEFLRLNLVDKRGLD